MHDTDLITLQMLVLNTKNPIDLQKNILDFVNKEKNDIFFVNEKLINEEFYEVLI